MITDYEHLPLGVWGKVLGLADDADNSLAIVSLLSGRTEDELLNMKLTDYSVLRDGAAFLYYQPTPAKLRDTYKVGGWVLHPTKIRDLCTAQYIDFKDWCSKDGDTTAELLSCLLVPEGKEYGEGYDALELIDALRDGLCVPDVLALRDFYFAGLVKLMRHSLRYSRKMTSRLTDRTAKKQMRRKIRELRLLGVGGGRALWTASQNSPAVLGTAFIQ